MAKARPKLTANEAQEYSNSLAKAAAGDYELMDFAINVLHVPESLGMGASEWIESIGGYVQRGVEDRREAVQQLTEDGKTQAQIATVLGISTATVARDQAVNEAATQLESGHTQEIGPSNPTPVGSVAEQRPQIRTMIDAGQTNAEIAFALGRGVATIEKERRAYNDEQTEASLEAARQQQAAATPTTPAEDAAFDAEMGEARDAVAAGITTAMDLSPLEALREADAELRQIMDNNALFRNFGECVSLWASIGQNLWVYGARRGLDVSAIQRLIDQMGGDE